MLYVFLDTTALHKSYRLRGTQWDSIQNAIERKVAVVVTSTITVMELERQAGRDAVSLRKSLADVRRQSERHYVEIPDTPIPFEAVAWRAQLGLRLEERCIRVLDRVDPSHDELLVRDFEDRFPFKPSGEGYRDTLIWLTFLDWLSRIQLTADDEVFFVSGNTTQFADDGKRGKYGKPLAGQLRDEVRAATSVEVKLLETLENLVTEIRPPSLAVKEAERQPSEISKPSRPSAPESAAADEPTAEDLAAAYAHDGEAEAISAARAKARRLDEDGIDFTSADLEFAGVILEAPPRALPPFENGSIMNIELTQDRDEAELVDELDETTQLWSVTIEADVELEGIIHKSELASLPDEATILDGDWNPYYMWVSTPLQVALRFDVRVETAADAEAELVGATALS